MELGDYPKAARNLASPREGTSRKSLSNMCVSHKKLPTLMCPFQVQQHVNSDAAAVDVIVAWRLEVSICFWKAFRAR